MAQYPPALAFTLGWEDPQHKYRTVPDAPEGAFAIAGVNSHAWPDDYVNIASYPEGSPARAAAVAAFYQSKFWSPILLGGLQSQDLANRVFDMAVNAGEGTAVRLLQRCLDSYGQHVVVDGEMGPLTIMAANQIDPQKLMAAYRVARVSHYEAIADGNPADEQYLQEWEERARA